MALTDISAQVAAIGVQTSTLMVILNDPTSTFDVADANALGGCANDLNAIAQTVTDRSPVTAIDPEAPPSYGPNGNEIT
jgi:hypothetical protein